MAIEVIVNHQPPLRLRRSPDVSRHHRTTAVTRADVRLRPDTILIARSAPITDRYRENHRPLLLFATRHAPEHVTLGRPVAFLGVEAPQTEHFPGLASPAGFEPGSAEAKRLPGPGCSPAWACRTEPSRIGTLATAARRWSRFPRTRSAVPESRLPRPPRETRDRTARRTALEPEQPRALIA